MSSALPVSPFAVDCPLQLAVGEHSQVAIAEPERVAVVELPSAKLLAEVHLSAQAEGVDLAWIGAPPRLLVVSRLSDHTVLHLLEVIDGGVRVCAEKSVEAAMRILATSGNYTLLAGPVSSAVLTRTDDNMAIHPVAARGVPAAAGPLGGQLAVALSGMIELWDPVSRVAKRRLKLPRPAQLRSIGGSERLIWLTTITEPNRVEVVPLVNRGQPRAHELPEAISQVAGHPRHDMLACLGADTGAVYILDLDGRTPTRTVSAAAFGGPPMALAMLGSRPPALVAVAAGRPPCLVTLEGKPLAEWPVIATARAASEPSASSPSLPAPRQAGTPVLPPARPAPPPAASGPTQPRAPTTPGIGAGLEPPPSIASAATVLRPARSRDEAGTAADPAASDAGSSGSWLERLAQWRARTEPAAVPPAPSAAAPVPVVHDARVRSDKPESSQPAAPLPSVLATSTSAAVAPAAPRQPPTPSAAGLERDALLAWARPLFAGQRAGAPPKWPRLELALDRLELPLTHDEAVRELAPLLAALYAAHLFGQPSLAPSEAIAACTGATRWREALAAGALGHAGAVRLRGSRLRLASELLRFLDERPAKHGELCGDDEGLPPREACACAWEPDEPLAPRAVAEALAARLGCAVLAVATPPPDPARLARVILEARLRNAVAALPYPWLLPLAAGPVIYVAPTFDEATATGLPLLEG